MLEYKEIRYSDSLPPEVNELAKSGLGGYGDYGTIRKSSLRFPSKHTKFIILSK